MKDTSVDDSKNSAFSIGTQKILADLHSGYVERFSKAVDKLKNSSEKQSRTLIAEVSPLLNHSDPEIRCDAIELLLLCNPLKTISSILPLLSDPVDFVRNCVCQELEFNEFYDQKVIDPLINCLLHDPFNDVRYRAAVLLGKIGDSKAIPALEWAIEFDKGENYEGDSISSRAKWALEEIQNRT